MTASSSPAQTTAITADLLGYYDINRLMLAEDTSSGLEAGKDPTLRIETQQSNGMLFADQKAYEAKLGLANSGLTLLGAQYIPTDGFYAVAYETADKHVIIGFQGSQFGTTLYDQSSEVADLDLVAHKIPNALLDAKTFASAVITGAQKLGISQANIDVTGMSLGGTEAEYAAEHLGLGGVAFAGTGLPGYIPPKGSHVSNFTDYVEYGDPVANFASDTAVKAALTPTNMDHYGAVVMLGQASAGAELTKVVDANPSALAMLNSPMMQYHNLNLYAADLHLITAGA